MGVSSSFFSLLSFFLSVFLRSFFFNNILKYYFVIKLTQPAPPPEKILIIILKKCRSSDDHRTGQTVSTERVSNCFYHPYIQSYEFVARHCRIVKFDIKRHTTIYIYILYTSRALLFYCPVCCAYTTAVRPPRPVRFFSASLYRR